MKFQVLGSGCAKCKTLAQHTEAAAQALGLDYELEKVTDMNAIIDAGVMSTPALAVNGDVKSTGKVLSVEEIKKLLSA
ncbi:MAG: TM0996/MTH895 family glutaredoxin-like protein [Candidatus Contendobacter sp.]|nr:TM0996/MTH895 family glutaredoxin-like protein [Candidatus Contendobacter sp.]RUQ31348.1 MAG: thioredoxin family protein [Candidatus Competibacteraceae bacterium]